MYYAQPEAIGYSKKFMTVFDNNVGAQDYIIKTVEQGKEITHIKTSGVTDLFFILPLSLEDAVEKYTSIIGKPVLTP